MLFYERSPLPIRVSSLADVPTGQAPCATFVYFDKSQLCDILPGANFPQDGFEFIDKHLGSHAEDSCQPAHMFNGTETHDDSHPMAFREG